MALPELLAPLVVKTGLSLGLLGQPERDAVLALAALGLPAGRDLREAEVNAALKTWLGAAGSMLRTDHVELRRWLVDTGFLWRDGYGHVYRRGEAEMARAGALLGVASAVEADAAIAAARGAARQRRESKRRVFEARR